MSLYTGQEYCYAFHLRGRCKLSNLSLPIQVAPYLLLNLLQLGKFNLTKRNDFRSSFFLFSFFLSNDRFVRSKSQQGSNLCRSGWATFLFTTVLWAICILLFFFTTVFFSLSAILLFSLPLGLNEGKKKLEK